MNNTTTNTKNLILCGLFTALLAICSWISIPTAVPFTLQTFAVFLCILMLDLKWSLASIICYILIGAIGLPVFAGFQSGFGIIAGPLGGYIIGFILATLLSAPIIKYGNGRKAITFAGLLAGLIVCYAFGTAWFVYIYGQSQPIGIIAALSMCVFPFIIPDILKILLAMAVASRLRNALKL